MLNTEKIFKDQFQIYLDKVEYNIGAFDTISNEELHHTDNISAKVEGDKVRLLFSRIIDAKVFRMEVRFGSILDFAVDISERPTEEEIVKGMEGTDILSNLISRVSLVISQLTSSFGQMPLITPPVMIKEV